MKRTLILTSAAVVAGCTTTSWSSRSVDAGFARSSHIYLETSQFLWVDAEQREQLACRNGTPVICTAAPGRLSFASCGCLPPANGN